MKPLFTAAIILAAGRSQRMGANKLLLPFRGSTVIGRVVDACLGAPIEQVIVVVRPSADEVRRVLAERTVNLVENPEAEGDMLSSLRCGLRALPTIVQTIVVAPADQPSLEPALVRRMLQAFHERQVGSARCILVPVHQGRRGHPVVLGARYRDELLTSYDGVGLRGLLKRHPAEVTEWPTDDPTVLQDLDTPADYDFVRRGLR